MAAARPLPDFLIWTTVACRTCTSSVLSACSTWRTRKNVRTPATATAAAMRGNTRRARSRQTSALRRRALSLESRMLAKSLPAASAGLNLLLVRRRASPVGTWASARRRWMREDELLIGKTDADEDDAQASDRECSP